MGWKTHIPSCAYLCSNDQKNVIKTLRSSSPCTKKCIIMNEMRLLWSIEENVIDWRKDRNPNGIYVNIGNRVWVGEGGHPGER
jgi:hypothetical protein